MVQALLCTITAQQQKRHRLDASGGFFWLVKLLVTSLSCIKPAKTTFDVTYVILLQVVNELTSLWIKCLPSSLVKTCNRLIVIIKLKQLSQIHLISAKRLNYSYGGVERI